jgi:hypothetical protein
MEAGMMGRGRTDRNNDKPKVMGTKIPLYEGEELRALPRKMKRMAILGSSLGRIFRIGLTQEGDPWWQELTQREDPITGKAICSADSKTIHVAYSLAMAFLCHPTKVPKKAGIINLNGNQLDNRISNLAWEDYDTKPSPKPSKDLKDLISDMLKGEDPSSQNENRFHRRVVVEVSAETGEPIAEFQSPVAWSRSVGETNNGISYILLNKGYVYRKQYYLCYKFPKYAKFGSLIDGGFKKSDEPYQPNCRGIYVDEYGKAYVMINGERYDIRKGS